MCGVKQQTIAQNAICRMGYGMNNDNNVIYYYLL